MFIGLLSFAGVLSFGVIDKRPCTQPVWGKHGPSAISAFRSHNFLGIPNTKHLKQRVHETFCPVQFMDKMSSMGHLDKMEIMFP